MDWAGVGAGEAGDLVPEAIMSCRKKTNVKEEKKFKVDKQEYELSLLEDINVEVGSVWVHLTLFDQKLLN